jgi:hypothetical protein
VATNNSLGDHGYLSGFGIKNDMWTIVNHTLFHKQLPTDRQGIYMVRCTPEGEPPGGTWAAWRMKNRWIGSSEQQSRELAIQNDTHYSAHPIYVSTLHFRHLI